MQEKYTQKLKGFIKHGIKFNGLSGDNAYGYCPFSDKDNKFYVNVKTLLWDSKTAGLSGNFNKFLECIHSLYKENITKKELVDLSENRHIPINELRKWEIGKCDSKYVLPIKNENGSIIDLRFYKFNDKLMSTPTCRTGLLNIEKIVTVASETPIYICEGEWDCISFNWLLEQAKHKGIAVGTPGANTFKDEWVPYFKNKKVFILYDNDNAGELGEQLITKKIGKIAKELYFLHWPERFPKGYDIRDFVALEGLKNKRPKRCFNKIQQMMKSFPRKEMDTKFLPKTSLVEKPEIDKHMSWEKYKDSVLKKWLRMPNYNHFLVGFAVILSNYKEGDRLWIQLVASPGEGKSEMLNSLKFCDEAYITSVLTPNALISGAVATRTGEEASLLPKLHNKTLVIKDGAAIQMMRQSDREQLMGILRDAYDGSAGKDFGTGEHKYFESKFSFLMGTTPKVYELEESESALGARTLKYFIGDYLHEPVSQIDVILKAMQNVGKENKMKEEISKGAYSLIENIKSHMKRKNYKHPEINESSIKLIANLAGWTATMRGTVSRDKYDRSVILTKAYTEKGTRTGKQYLSLLLCLPTVIMRGYETEDELAIIKKVALDSISSKREDIFRAVYLKYKNGEESIEIKKIVLETKYSYTTVSRVLEDLTALTIINRIGNKSPFRYALTDKMKEFTSEAGLYEDELNRNRKYRSLYAKKEGKKLKK